jgi:hypothetical protein
MNASTAVLLRDEAAYEALGILEVMYDSGEIPLVYRDLVAVVVEKHRVSKRDAAPIQPAPIMAALYSHFAQVKA